MDKDTITLIVSVVTLVSTFSVAYAQMKIASAKIKLDLYNKRFAVYISALDYYQATWDEPHDKIKEKGKQLTKSYRESKFLFEPSDGVYETIGKIQWNGTVIRSCEEHKHQRENNLTDDRLCLSTLHELSMKARDEFERNLLELERQMDKYIQFKAISGWRILSVSDILCKRGIRIFRRN